MENVKNHPAMIMLKMDWSLMQIVGAIAENALMTKAAVQTQIAHPMHALAGYAWKLIHAKMEF